MTSIGSLDFLLFQDHGKYYMKLESFYIVYLKSGGNVQRFWLPGIGLRDNIT